MLPEHLDGLQKGMRRASKVIVPDNGGAVGAITCIWSGLALASRPGERSISGTYLCVLRRPIKCSILLISGGEGLGRMGGGSSDASPYFRIVFSWWLHVGSCGRVCQVSGNYALVLRRWIKWRKMDQKWDGASSCFEPVSYYFIDATVLCNTIWVNDK